jgi:two-component system CheB/CheR fusion protein
VLTNDKGDILYVSGHTGKYLEPAAGKANWNLFAMAREGLRYELADAFKKALRQKAAVALHGLKVGTNGGEQCVNVAVQRLDEPGPLQGLVMIVFTDVAAPEAARFKPTARGWQSWSRKSWPSAARPAPPTRRCRPRRRNSGPPTRNCNPPMKNCSPPTRNS